MKRRGVTLVEFLVVILIIGVLFGLILMAVLSARKMAYDLECKNNLRQIVVGHVGYFGHEPVFGTGDWQGMTVLTPYPEILGYVGYPIVDPSEKNNFRMQVPNVSFLRCPSDLTLFGTEKDLFFNEYTSYPYNAYVFTPNRNFANSILDGLSNTIGFSERFGNLPSSLYLFTVCGGAPTPQLAQAPRPSTFADIRYGDNTPKNDPATNFCTGSVTGETFLICPNPLTAPGSEMISGHAGGINLGFLDGSVRFVAREVSPSVFWAQVTPAAGD